MDQEEQSHASIQLHFRFQSKDLSQKHRQVQHRLCLVSEKEVLSPNRERENQQDSFQEREHSRDVPIASVEEQWTRVEKQAAYEEVFRFPE